MTAATSTLFPLIASPHSPRRLVLTVRTPAASADPRFLERAVAAVRAGADAVLLQQGDAPRVVALAALAELSEAMPVPVLVSGEAAIALAAQRLGLPIAGVHLPDERVPARELRARLDARIAIGLTVTSRVQVARASTDDVHRRAVDFVIARRVAADARRTALMPRTPRLGLEEVIRGASMPVLVDAADAMSFDIDAALLAGICLDPAVADAVDPEREVRDARAALRFPV